MKDFALERERERGFVNLFEWKAIQVGGNGDGPKGHSIGWQMRWNRAILVVVDDERSTPALLAASSFFSSAHFRSTRR